MRNFDAKDVIMVTAKKRKVSWELLLVPAECRPLVDTIVRVPDEGIGRLLVIYCMCCCNICNV